MLNVYDNLFDLYGDFILHESGCCIEREIDNFMAPLHLDADTKGEMQDFLSNAYYRWSTNAFALGVHLGLSLSNGKVGGMRPQERQ